MPAMTDSWCQLKWCCRIGVSPLGAQVRTRGGPLAQSRLVDEDDDPSLFCSVFFRAGQRVCFQRLIAASSRSSARPEGRWQEKPSETRIRQTWLSLYERPKRRLI